MYFFLALLVAILCAWRTPVCAQPRQVPPIEVKPSVPAIVDSVYEEDHFTRPNTDSARIFDSLYAVRRSEIMARMKETPYVPAEEFISARIMSTALGRYRASDIQRYFAERVGRPDLDDEGDNISGLDYMVSFAVEAKLASSLGVFAQYGYTGKDYQTVVSASADPNRIPNGRAELEVISHDFTAGPTVTPFSTSFVRLKLYAGLGPAMIQIREYEEASKAERNGSASGLAIVFETEFDFRVIDQLSFGISLFTKQISAGEIEVDGNDLSSPFGKRAWTTETKPEASYITACLGVGMHFYF